MKLCEDCKNDGSGFVWPVPCTLGKLLKRTENDCEYYKRKWYKFWRPK